MPTNGAPLLALARENTERPHAPSGVAAFMSAHSKPPYITPGMGFPSGKGVVLGRSVQQLDVTFGGAAPKKGTLHTALKPVVAHVTLVAMEASLLVHASTPVLPGGTEQGILGQYI